MKPLDYIAHIIIGGLTLAGIGVMGVALYRDPQARWVVGALICWVLAVWALYRVVEYWDAKD